MSYEGFLPGLNMDERLAEAIGEGGAARAIKRLPNGEFAPKGLGTLLGGSKVRVPHKSGKGNVAGKVNPDGKSVRLLTGPDAGMDLTVNKHHKTAPAPGAEPKEAAKMVSPAEAVAKMNAPSKPLAGSQKEYEDKFRGMHHASIQATIKAIKDPEERKRADAADRKIGGERYASASASDQKMKELRNKSHEVAKDSPGGRGTGASAKPDHGAEYSAARSAAEKRVGSAAVATPGKKPGKAKQPASAPKTMGDVDKGDWVRNKSTGQVRKIKDMMGDGQGYDINFKGSRGKSADWEPVGVKPKIQKTETIDKEIPGKSASGESSRSKVIVDGEHVADVVKYTRYHQETNSVGMGIGHSRSREFHVTPPGAKTYNGSMSVYGDKSGKQLTRVNAFTQEEAIGSFLAGKAKAAPFKPET